MFFRAFRGEFLLLLSSPAYAERKYTLGTDLTLMGGASNRVGNSSFALKDGMLPFAAVLKSGDVVVVP